MSETGMVPNRFTPDALREAARARFAARQPSAAAPDQARRAKVRLLRDLVAHGLYRVRPDALADRLLDVVQEQRDSS